MRVAVLRFPGTNCELDTHHAFTQLGADVEIVWHNEQKLPEAIDLVVLAGGFSYGDYLRSGAIARFSPIMKAVVEYANEGNCVLGICNGFQILTEIGLLPGALKRNNNLHFISKFQTIKVIHNDNKFLSQCSTQEILNVPIAHADGNYYINPEQLDEIESNGQVLLRYCDSDGEPLAINGSLNAIAGVCNKNKNVFGLMPHPERAMEAILGSMDGKKMLEGFMN
ncbi:MAG: phosphoribosylformylglycinamidine synthase [Sulfurovum sp. FS08-3]|nr:MAG: phosphoribosylformylglycinamidine synthase [Sulfurovum sp. FS08-3]